MAVTVARDTIVCPTCGSQRVVTIRQARRARTLANGIPCTVCRGIGPTRPVRDEDYRWWLRRYGVKCPADVSPREFIVASGVPPELAELALDVFPQ